MGDDRRTMQEAYGRVERRSLGQVSPAYSAVDWHAVRRLRRWLCLKHKVKTGKYVRFPDTRLRDEYGLTRLSPRTKGLCMRRHDLVRKPDAGNPHVRFDERGLETRQREPD